MSHRALQSNFLAVQAATMLFEMSFARIMTITSWGITRRSYIAKLVFCLCIVLILVQVVNAAYIASGSRISSGPIRRIERGATCQWSVLRLVRAFSSPPYWPRTTCSIVLIYAVVIEQFVTPLWQWAGFKRSDLGLPI